MGNHQSLRSAMERGQWRDVRRMLEKDEGARTRARTKAYHVGAYMEEPSTVSALHIACLHNPPEDIVRTLLRLRPDSGTAQAHPSGECPLHFAVRCTRAGPADVAARVLVEACPASLRCSSNIGYGKLTPLHLACSIRAHPLLISVLSEADPTAAGGDRDVQGHTAWEIARKNSGIGSLRWRWRVRAILRANSDREHHQGQEPELEPELEPEVDPDPNPEPEPVVAEAKGVVVFAPPSAPPLPVVEGEDMCVVCWDGRADHAVVPCGHLCLCEVCGTAGELKATLRGRCPVCKGKAETSLRVFRAGVPYPAGGWPGETVDDDEL